MLVIKKLNLFIIMVMMFNSFCEESEGKANNKKNKSNKIKINERYFLSQKNKIIIASIGGALMIFGLIYKLYNNSKDSKKTVSIETLNQEEVVQTNIHREKMSQNNLQETRFVKYIVQEIVGEVAEKNTNNTEIDNTNNKYFIIHIESKPLKLPSIEEIRELYEKIILLGDDYKAKLDKYEKLKSRVLSKVECENHIDIYNRGTELFA